MDVVELAVAERTDLLELGRSLSSEQWSAPSLCRGWTVLDVVAHVVSFDELSAVQLGRRALGGRAWPDAMNAVGVREYAVGGPDGVLEVLARSLRPRGVTALFGSRVALTDTVVHQQDIRRPLDLPRRVPVDRLAAVLPFAMVAPPTRGGWRTRGLRLAATDVDWSWGRGPEVTGPGEALLLAACGRADALSGLAGPGLPVLAARLGPPD
ncbi:TIGR03083 family protein [Klenkia soli]|uniref:TIGR03083 family protein n=1 Tax=Klenkia soli TaxID=1052260 RepID=A0A1H0CR85_9ACTN|nr:maleylpyruvate isomerase family mycothiol-dependent enzyme [Klenkia soli]SDN60345.1 TIGR03083 family protein [Klenkia soli]